jgi:hypothetical protein
MLLDGIQIEEIARLEPGEAYFYTEGLHSPRRVRCLNANAYLRLSDHVDAASITAIISKEDWFIQDRTDRIAEVRNQLVETNELLEQIGSWCKNNAFPALNNLYDRWKAVQSQVASAESSSFGQQCEDIIEDCVVFQDLIHEKSRCFTNSAAQYARMSQAVAGDHEDLQLLVDQLKTRWNEVEQPQLVSLYNRLEELETDVRNSIARQEETSM